MVIVASTYLRFYIEVDARVSIFLLTPTPQPYLMLPCFPCVPLLHHITPLGTPCLYLTDSGCKSQSSEDFII
jgi:hypothetical protein